MIFRPRRLGWGLLFDPLLFIASQSAFAGSLTKPRISVANGYEHVDGLFSNRNAVRKGAAQNEPKLDEGDR